MNQLAKETEAKPFYIFSHLLLIPYLLPISFYCIQSSKSSFTPFQGPILTVSSVLIYSHQSIHSLSDSTHLGLSKNWKFRARFSRHRGNSLCTEIHDHFRTCFFTEKNARSGMRLDWKHQHTSLVQYLFNLDFMLLK